MIKQSVFMQRRVLSVGAVPAYRSFAADTLKDKEKGDERIFFTKNDGKWLYIINHLQKSQTQNENNISYFKIFLIVSNLIKDDKSFYREGS